MNLLVTKKRNKISASLNQITKLMKLYICTVLRSQGFSSVHHFTCPSQSLLFPSYLLPFPSILSLFTNYLTTQVIQTIH